MTGAPMTLNALEISNIYGTSGTVSGLLQEHYTSNMKANLLKLIASSDLIGNPTDFVNTLGTGAKQFYYEPKEGFGHDVKEIDHYQSYQPKEGAGHGTKEKGITSLMNQRKALVMI